MFRPLVFMRFGNSVVYKIMFDCITDPSMKSNQTIMQLDSYYNINSKYLVSAYVDKPLPNNIYK